MSRPKFRGEATYYDSLGSLQVTSTLAALNTTGVALLAAPGAGKRYLVKSYSIGGSANGVGSSVYLTDGTDTMPIVVAQAGNTIGSPGGWVVCHGNGVKFAANTALTVKASINAAAAAAIVVKYDIVDSTGSDG